MLLLLVLYIRDGPRTTKVHWVDPWLIFGGLLEINKQTSRNNVPFIGVVDKSLTKGHQVQLGEYLYDVWWVTCRHQSAVKEGRVRFHYVKNNNNLNFLSEVMNML